MVNKCCIDRSNDVLLAVEEIDGLELVVPRPRLHLVEQRPVRDADLVALGDVADRSDYDGAAVEVKVGVGIARMVDQRRRRIESHADRLRLRLVELGRTCQLYDPETIALDDLQTIDYYYYYYYYYYY